MKTLVGLNGGAKNKWRVLDTFASFFRGYGGALPLIQKEQEALSQSEALLSKITEKLKRVFGFNQSNLRCPALH